VGHLQRRAPARHAPAQRARCDDVAHDDVTRLFVFLPPAKGKYAGGNPVCARPTPTWQKGIGDFFGGPPRKPEKENLRPQEEVEDEEEAGGSGVTSRK